MKKNRILIYPLIIMGALFILTFSCKKDDSSSAQLPVLTTSTVSGITITTATCGGNITSDGGSAVTVKGVCWSSGQTPTIADSKTTNGTGAASFTSDLANLVPNTAYYVRAYATTTVGTGYGNAMSFTTLGVYEPGVTTSIMSDITQTSATLGGNVTSAGGSPITERGVCWSTGQSPTIADNKISCGTGYGSFTCPITNLSPNTTYYVRAYAINEYFTGYGSIMGFNTLEVSEPVLQTSYVSELSPTTATFGGDIASDGGSTVTARGVCWGLNPTPTIADSKTTDGTGIGIFTSTISGLNPNTQYYVRSYASNNYFTGYGSILPFRTFGATVTDIDGNVYNTILIGTQTWMAENLKTTKYRNGDPIINSPSIEEWTGNDLIGRYCSYDNDVNNANTYGLLYNEPAIWDVRNICPNGWHVPSGSELNVLSLAFFADDLKEVGSVHWWNSSTGATNISGFTALGAGKRHGSGTFESLGSSTVFYSSNQQVSYSLSYQFLLQYAYGYYDGLSVRCIKDN